MTFVQITSTQTDAKSPIDVQLMDTGLRLNFDDHEARILALEAGGGSSGGSTDPELDPRYGSIVSGCRTNEAKYWRKRYHSVQQVLNSGEKILDVSGFDPSQEDQSRWINTTDHVRFTILSDTEAYLGEYTVVPKSRSFEFHIKPGENFFGIGYSATSTTSDTVEVYIDGLSVTGFGGIVDQNGAAQTNSFSATASPGISQATQYFYGLDNKAHTIKIVNNDSGTDDFLLEFIEVGFASKEGNYTIDNTLKVTAGRINVRGTEVANIETDLTFSSTAGYGKTSALIGTTAGVLSILEGVEPAMTQAKPETAITFSSAVTSMKVKNHYYFPSSGFVLVSNPYGHHYMASYTSKTGADVANHTLSGMIWQNQPVTDFTPEDAFTTGTLGSAKGSINVNLWASGGHEISSSNNKLDFKITVNGTQTTHAATIPSGLYSADLVPLGPAIENAMQAAKPLTNGSYRASYNKDAERWDISVYGANVSELQLLFSSGANVANSIHTTIGYNTTDLTGKIGYVAQNDKQSLAHRVFRAGSYIWANDARVKASRTSTEFNGDLVSRRGLPAPRYMAGVSSVDVYPDEDACGLAAYFQMTSVGSVIVAIVDDGPQIYALSNDQLGQGSRNSKIGAVFVSFPRGSKKITFFNHSNAQWEFDDNSNEIVFFGARQYHTKPKEESLTSSQAILKTFDVAPIQLFATYYADNYTPGSNDNIDTITYTGSWAANTSQPVWNNRFSRTSTANDTVDLTFTLAGSGGGAGFIIYNGGRTPKAGMFLTSGASAVETGNRLYNENLNVGTIERHFYMVRTLGLAAGQYTLRLKNESGGNNLDVLGFVVVDTVQPDKASVVNLVTNTSQSVSFPINTVKRNYASDSSDRTPDHLLRSGYREGLIHVDFGTNQIQTLNDDEVIDNAQDRMFYYSFWGMVAGNTNDYIRGQAFGRSFLFTVCTRSDRSTDETPSINGSTFGSFSTRTDTKSGGAIQPINNNDVGSPLFQKHFKQAGTSMTNSTTIPVASTKGMRVGQTILVSADSQPTLKRVINTITTDTSITITEAISGFANYTTANNVAVTFPCFFSARIDHNDATNSSAYSTFEYEPMIITASKDEDRRLSKNKIGETASIMFRGISSGADLYYPVFSDGRLADWTESSIDVIKSSTTLTSLNFPFDLRNITFGGGGTIDVKITSVRRY